MTKNTNLHNAKNAKNDEFYTRLTDIEKELKNYREHFRGKVVYCNCDDARESNFFKFFTKNFEFLGLKKLITTGYKPTGKGVVLTYEGDKNGNKQVDDNEIQVNELNGDGDFRSEECIAFLKEADIVVTNPPFSLFREYVAQLMEYGKKFLIIGNPNAITYKETFPLIKENKLWLGYKSSGTDMLFDISKEFADELVKTKKEGSAYKIVDGEVKGRAMAIWFTNLEHSKRNERLELTKRYSNEYYPKYDNYDAIEVGKTVDIPLDYEGVMGVPISFLDKYNPDQFEIIWTSDRGGDGKIEFLKNKEWNGLWDSCFINGKKCYKRIFIRYKK